MPKGTPVKSEIAPVLGGLSDKRPSGAIDQSLPAITIRGEVVFGGVEINDQHSLEKVSVINGNG